MVVRFLDRHVLRQPPLDKLKLHANQISDLASGYRARNADERNLVRKQIQVVGAVIVRDGTVLCAQRGKEMALPGLWEFPGGKVEAGESEQAALVREIAEELLCMIEVGSPVDTTTHTYDFGNVTLATYYATLTDGEPQAMEHEAIRWIPASDLMTVEWAPADIPAVKQVIRDYAPTPPNLSTELTCCATRRSASSRGSASTDPSTT